MRWRKLGRIYAPAGLGDWALSHAAVPIALRLDSHRWRIYFSARDRRNRAHTGFFEIDLRRPARPLRVHERPVLSPGGLGAFDEDGAMGSWIVQGDERLLLYYTGWNLGVTVPFRNSIGLAESLNGGESFIRVSVGPLLDRSIHDPFFTANPCLLIENGRWRMWYLSCVTWEPASDGRPVHRYHIKYAESANSLEWRRRGCVCIDFQKPDEIALARPCVLRDGDRYRMWYSRRGPSYRIGYAESDDGLSWRRLDEKAGIDVSASGWDSEMIAYAFIFDAEGERYMLYNGNGYGATGIGMAVLEAD
jgi:hypothetical protein